MHWGYAASGTLPSILPAQYNNYADSGIPSRVVEFFNRIKTLQIAHIDPIKWTREVKVL